MVWQENLQNVWVGVNFAAFSGRSDIGISLVLALNVPFSKKKT